MPFQNNNDAKNGLDSAFFQRRYEVNFAWVNAYSAAMLMPRVRAFWPISSVDENQTFYDVSGQARHLTDGSGTVGDGFDILAPYATFNGVNDYLYRLDEPGLQFAGTIGFGGWFYFYGLSAEYTLMSKWGAAGNRSYRVIRTSGNKFRFDVSGDGTAIVSVESALAMTDRFRYYFVFATFIQNTRMTLWTNISGDLTKTRLAKAENTTSIPAPLFNSTANFEIGRSNATSYLNGSVSIPILCDVGVRDEVVEAYFQQTRALFSG